MVLQISPLMNVFVYQKPEKKVIYVISSFINFTTTIFTQNIATVIITAYNNVMCLLLCKNTTWYMCVCVCVCGACVRACVHACVCVCVWRNKWLEDSLVVLRSWTLWLKSVVQKASYYQYIV